MANLVIEYHNVNKEQLEVYLADIQELFKTGEELLATLMKEKEYADAELIKIRKQNHEMRSKISCHAQTQLNELAIKTSIQKENEILRQEKQELEDRIEQCAPSVRNFLLGERN
jgi:hypothetical protein